VQDVRQVLWRNHHQLAALLASGRQLNAGERAPSSMELHPLTGATGEIAQLFMQGKDLAFMRFSAATARRAQAAELAPGLIGAVYGGLAAEWLDSLSPGAIKAGQQELAGLVANGGPAALAAARTLCRARLGGTCIDSVIRIVKLPGPLNLSALQLAIEAKRDHPELIALVQHTAPSKLSDCMAEIRGVPPQACEAVAKWLREHGRQNLSSPSAAAAIRCLHKWGWCAANLDAARSLIVKPISKSAKDLHEWLQLLVDLHQIPEAETVVLKWLKHVQPIAVVARLRTVSWVSDRVVEALKDLLLHGRCLELKHLVLQVASTLENRIEMMHIGIVEVMRETAGRTSKVQHVTCELASELLTRLENGRSGDIVSQAPGVAGAVAIDPSSAGGLKGLLALRRAVLVAAAG